MPLLAIGTSAGAVRLLADPDAAPGSILAGVGADLRPLAVAHDGLTQAVTAPPTGLRVVLTDGGAVTRSGTVLPGRLSPVTGTVELTRSTLDLARPSRRPRPGTTTASWSPAVSAVRSSWSRSVRSARHRSG